MPQLWSDDYLSSLVDEAHADITNKIPCIFDRFYLTTSVGRSTYTLPSFVKGILRITWRGYRVDPVTWEEMLLLDPKSAVINETTKVESSSGRPFWYALSPTNNHEIKFYPALQEAFSSEGGDPFSPSVYEPRLTVSCFRTPVVDSPTLDLPSYIARRTIKAFVLYRAFAKEGRGQDLKGSGYYKGKYDFLIRTFNNINSFVFMAKRYALGESDEDRTTRRPGKPTLPANFERTIYR